jgi:hypothetical protein
VLKQFRAVAGQVVPSLASNSEDDHQAGLLQQAAAADWLFFCYQGQRNLIGC